MDPMQVVREPPDLERQIQLLIGQIPAGRVATCGDLARALGDLRAARWVGRYLVDHAHRRGCPCHRVVRADGSLGSYVSGDTEEKRRRLAAEGVPLAGGAVDLLRARWSRLSSDQPLAQLRAVQRQLAGRVKLHSDGADWHLVAGLDVAYPQPREAVAAYVLLELRSLRRIWQATVRRPALFPYISSYLAFRELPILLELVDQARRQRRLADVLMVDGSGLMHPSGAGIASHLGVVADMPTVGVTKKLLCGQGAWRTLAPGGSCPIRCGSQVVGVAIRHRRLSRRPLFVSPGHRIDVEGAARLVRATLADHRLPEPIYWADRLSRQAPEAGADTG